MNNTFNSSELLTIWEQIGNNNRWIKLAVDPPFSKKCLEQCLSLKVLEENLKAGNWQLGQGFYFENICFINQVDGGDEWLVIRGDLAFESYTIRPTIKSGSFETLFNRFKTATREQLRLLTY